MDCQRDCSISQTYESKLDGNKISLQPQPHGEIHDQENGASFRQNSYTNPAYKESDDREEISDTCIDNANVVDSVDVKANKRKKSSLYPGMEDFSSTQNAKRFCARGNNSYLNQPSTQRALQESPNTYVSKPQAAGEKLQMAAKTGDLSALDCLLRQHQGGGEHSISQNYFNASLLEACRVGRKIIVQKLVRLGADVNTKGYKRCSTPLHLAAQQGFVDICDFLLNKDANVDADDRKGNTPLILAVNCAGSSDMLNLLISHKANVNKQNSSGTTALMKAVEVMDIDAIRILMCAGSDLDLKKKGKNGKTARDIAASLGLSDVFDLLKNERKMWSEYVYRNKSRALTKAAIEGHSEAVKLFLDCRFSEAEARHTPKNKEANERARFSALQDVISSISSDAEKKKDLDVTKLESVKILLTSGRVAGTDTSYPYANVLSSHTVSKMLINATQSGVYELVEVICKVPNIKFDFRRAHGFAHEIAAEMGRSDILKLLLNIEVDPKNKNHIWDNALTAALSHGQIECAKILLQEYKPTREDFWRMSQSVVAQGQFESLQFLHSLCDLTETSQSLVNQAVLSGNTKIVQFLVSHGADINGPSDGWYWKPALLIALSERVEQNPIDMVKFLIEKGACVNKTPPWDSPIATAMKYCNMCKPDVLKGLVENGADVNEVNDENGMTPLLFLFYNSRLKISEHNSEMLKILLEAGADPNKAMKNGSTALHLAVTDGNIQSVKLLLDAGSGLEAKDSSGLTPMLLAAKRSRYEIISELKKYGANMEAVDENGKNALICSLGCGPSDAQVKTMRLLNLDKDEINTQTSDGRSPLILAARSCNAKGLEILLEIGADPHVIDHSNNKQETALSILLESTQFRSHLIPSVKELIRHGALQSLPKDHCFPLYRMIMSGDREIVQLAVTHGMIPFCIDNEFVLVPASPSKINDSYAHNFSPLKAALIGNQHTIARYLVENWFLTPIDVVGSDNLRNMRVILEDLHKSQGLAFLDEYMSQPMTLMQLSFVATSAQLGEMVGREERVRKTLLPVILQDKLLFKGENCPMGNSAENEENLWDDSKENNEYYVHCDSSSDDDYDFSFYDGSDFSYYDDD